MCSLPVELLLRELCLAFPLAGFAVLFTFLAFMPGVTHHENIVEGRGFTMKT